MYQIIVRKNMMKRNGEIMKRCSNCLLPETYPGIVFNESNICNVCINYERRWKNKDYRKEEVELKKIFNYYKNKNTKYDCIVPLSGGKDSVYTAYVCKKKYDLNILAVNFDNGFQTPEAVENMKNAVKKLNIDFISFAPKWELLQRMYSVFFEKTGNFCTPCNQGILSTIYRIAEKEKIQLIVFGGSLKLEPARTFGGIRYCMEELFKGVLKDDIPQNDLKDFLIKPIRRKMFFQPILLGNYIDWNMKEIITTLKTELGWKEASWGEDHADCMISSINSYLKKKKYGFGKETIYYTSLVRDGQINKEEALKRISIAEQVKEPIIMKHFLGQLNLKKEDLYKIELQNLLDFVDKGKKVLDFSYLEKEKGLKIEERVQKIIETIRSDLRIDGGDVEIVNIVGSVVNIRFKKACSGCAMTQMVSMLAYIEEILTKFVPSVSEVKVAVECPNSLEIFNRP